MATSTASAARRRLAAVLLRHRSPTPLPSLRRSRIPIPLSDLHATDPFRHFSSKPRDPPIPVRISRQIVQEHDHDSEDDSDEDEEDDEDEDGSERLGPRRAVGIDMTEEEKVEAAEGIGYRVVGPLEESENPFKPYEPVFAVVQIGSHQFKVSNRDSIFVERLKYCEVNDKLLLNKVLMLGSATQTIIGRPILPEAAVYAVVEEHALDAKVIIFKKKRRKNYRRCKGHRQELTKLRITDIQGIEKPINVAVAA